jgi:hypothetical protein
MDIRGPYCPGTAAIALVNQTEQVALGYHLETAGDFRSQHDGNAVAVGLYTSETP